MTTQTGLVLCIVNQPDVHLGRFKPLLEERGLSCVEVEASSPELASIHLEDVGGLISLGGEMGALDADQYPFLATEIVLLRAAHARGLPVLGICLGGQLLAAALGGAVHARRGGEIGWLEVDHLVEDPVLGPPGVRRQFQWHYDSFDIPPGAKRVAASAACANQAFRSGSSYGLQFHPEVSMELLRKWLSPAGRAQLAGEGVDPDKLLAEAAELDRAYERQAEMITAGFAGLVGTRA